MIDKLRELTAAYVYEPSLSETDEGTLFLVRRGEDTLLGHVASEGAACCDACEGRYEQVGEIDGRTVCLEPADHAAAEKLRRLLPRTAPKPIGLSTSAGLGDRLGLATPGHVRAVKGSGLAPVFAQQSIREMERTDRTPDQVMDCATFGVFQEGWTEGFGSDADHLQEPEHIDRTAAAGFTMFTIDPGKHVVNEADELDADMLADKYAGLDFETLRTRPEELRDRYYGKRFDLPDAPTIEFDEQSFFRAAVKYGGAIAHVVKMYRHLAETVKRPFEVEVSVDETESPTSPGEHYFFAAELKRLGVEWVSMAPRFVGRFEKGVDYIGDLDEFRESFKRHVAVMRALGPYKISIHSGSDKFSIYPIVAELTDGMVHLKTAGTSYLEALRAVASIDPGLYRESLEFAREHYARDKATYHVSADISKVPASETLSDADLPGLLDQFDTRQAFHVTFGSVLTADGGKRFGRRIYNALREEEEVHYAALEKHLKRHVEPFSEYAK